MRLNKTQLEQRISEELIAFNQVQQFYYPEFRIVSPSKVRHRIYEVATGDYLGIIIADVDRDTHDVTVKFHPHIDKLQYVDSNEILWEYNLEDSQADRLGSLRSDLFDKLKAAFTS